MDAPTQFRKHIVDILGEPMEEIRIDEGGKFPLTLMAYTDDAVMLCFTCGMSIYPEQIGSKCELLFEAETDAEAFTDEEVSDLKRLFTTAARHALSASVQLAYGESIGDLAGQDYPILRECEKSAFFVTGLQPNMRHLIPAGDITVFQASLISTAELTYLKAHGKEALMARFWAGNVAPQDIYRNSSVDENTPPPVTIVEEPDGLSWSKTLLARIATRVDATVDRSKLSATGKLVHKLLDLGGERVCILDDEPEGYRHWMCLEGLPCNPKAVVYEPGEDNNCHRNCALIWQQDSAAYSIEPGYTLSADGLWRQHTWLIDKQGTLTETTTERTAYFGVRLYGQAARDF